METEPNVLVALLAIRTLGGRSAPANHEILKALKKLVQEAVAKGLLKEDTHSEQVPVEGKKPKTVRTKVIALTEEGENRLRASADPQALAATQARAVAAEAEALRRSLDADREALKQQVQVALAGRGNDKGAEQLTKDAGKLGKDVEKIAKAIEALTEKVRQLEEKQPKATEDTGSLTAKIDAAFAALGAKLDQALRGLPKPAGQHAAPATHHHPAPAAAPKPAEAPKPAAAPDSLQATLRKAYETLCCFREFQEGVVELPRLYHEAKRARPDLSVEEFQREILGLETKRAVDLHIRNEVRDAPEPEKAIRRNDKLYYYVYWPRQ